MISMIILGALGLLTILGLARLVLKDFRMGAIVAVIFFALVIGLNFIPAIVWGAFTFRIGTMIFYIAAIVMFFVYGRFVSQMTALAIAIILGGLAFAATRLSLLGNNAFFGDTNFVYALIIGVLAFVFTRNGKYSFIVAVEAMMILNLLVQIGKRTVSLDYGFDWTIVAAATGVVLFAIMARMAMKPSKMSYYFEAGRLED